MNILLILLLSTGAKRIILCCAGRQQLGRWRLGPAPLGHHPEGGQHGRTGVTRCMSLLAYTPVTSLQARLERRVPPITFISDVKWGASIRADSSHRSVWENGDANPGVAGNYINIINFDITGVALGNSPRFGIFNESSYCQFIGNNIHNVAENTTTIGYGGAGIDSGPSPPRAPGENNRKYYLGQLYS